MLDLIGIGLYLALCAISVLSILAIAVIKIYVLLLDRCYDNTVL